MKWFRKISPKVLLICVLSVTVLAVTAGVALAYFTTTTPAMTNQFTRGVVDISIVEPNGSSYTTSNLDQKVIEVTNVNHPGRSVSAYVRVRLVPILRRTNGEGSGDPVTVTYNANDTLWQRDGDYYYYKGALNPGDSTERVINSATVTSVIPPDEYLEIQAIADAVQTTGEAAKEAWHMQYSNGTWTNAS